jgi:hypothetical protein
MMIFYCCLVEGDLSEIYMCWYIVLLYWQRWFTLLSLVFFSL